MPNRLRYLYFFFLLSLLMMGLRVAEAAPPIVVTLRATREIVYTKGRDQTFLIATVRDTSGRPITGNVEVQFQTSLGRLSATRVFALGGTAQVSLTSPVAGVARVTAVVPGMVSDPVDILFTDDPEATFQGNNYMSVNGNYVAYSAVDQIIEATGKGSKARVTYRNVQITADRLYLECKTQIVRASGNVLIRRGKNELKANRIYYSLYAGEGYGLAELEGRPQMIYIAGERLRVEPLEKPIPSSYMQFPELSLKLVLVARNIDYFPGSERLQMHRVKVYQDQAVIATMLHHTMTLDSPDLFTDQFISMGTSGFGLAFPFYYDMTPRSTGTLWIRHQERQGRSFFAQNTGWALDLMQDYSSTGSKRYSGQVGFVGLTRGDWSFRWGHNHELSPSTFASINVDFPQHNSIFTVANFNQEAKRFRWGANLSGGQTFFSPMENNMRSDVFVETQPRKLGSLKDYTYTLGMNYTSNRTRLSEGVDFVGLNQTTQGLTFRTFSRPIPINRRTTLTNSFSLGQVWSDQNNGGFTSMATLALDHTLRGGSTVRMTYDFVNRPAALFASGGKHRFSLDYSLTSSRRFTASVYGIAFADNPDSTLYADAIYQIDKNWRLIGVATLQRFAGESFDDFQVTIGRRIGAREVQFTYSTFNRRFSLDFMATRF
jgi:hypothetical protein